MTLRFHLAETELGWMGLVLSPRGLRATTLPRPSRDEALREVVELGAAEPASDGEAAAAARLVRDLAAGRPADAAALIDWGGVSANGFRQAVMEETLRIPRGETGAYGWLAERVGRPRAARAVGRVMATNPLPVVVPCHRVVGSDGSLRGYGDSGRGRSAAGLWMKAALLRAEGVRG